MIGLMDEMKIAKYQGIMIEDEELYEEDGGDD